jgi:hypothetical protein
LELSQGLKRPLALQQLRREIYWPLISKVGITLLASATLNETLDTIVSLVFESVPADRCLIMMRDEGHEDLRVRSGALERSRRRSW